MERATLVEWCAAMDDHDVDDCDDECEGRCNLWRIIRHVLQVSEEMGIVPNFVLFMEAVHTSMCDDLGTENAADFPPILEYLRTMTTTWTCAEAAIALLTQLPETRRIPAVLLQVCAEEIERIALSDAPHSDAIPAVPNFMEMLSPTGSFVLHNFMFQEWFKCIQYDRCWVKFLHCGVWHTESTNQHYVVNIHDEQPTELRCVMCGVLVDYWE